MNLIDKCKEWRSLKVSLYEGNISYSEYFKRAKKVFRS